MSRYRRQKQVRKARALHEAGEIRRAIALLEKILEQEHNRSIATIWELLGECHYLSKDYLQAGKCWYLGNSPHPKAPALIREFENHCNNDARTILLELRIGVGTLHQIQDQTVRARIECLKSELIRKNQWDDFSPIVRPKSELSEMDATAWVIFSFFAGLTIVLLLAIIYMVKALFS